ncbi:30S ribosomal protein S27ae [Candidatus Woesearchaeota archaeon]|nr:30S ribosomal protein S27ae [Candidatus Woesearchaeota archaeon]
MAEKKGAAAKKVKRTSKRYKAYQVSGNSLTRKNRFCPKCGTGVFMASHKDRNTCGTCGYMEKKKGQ